LFAAAPLTAEQPPRVTQTAELRARLERLVARDDAKYAEGPIEQARLALDRASEPGQDPGVSARSQEIAHAALVLAERQLDRRRTQLSLFATQRRLTAIRERAQAQRRVLEALMRERASLARQGELR
jgi:hypothetical protein